MDLATAAQPTDTEMQGYTLYIVPRGQSKQVMLRGTRYDALSLVPKPSSRPVFVIHGSSIIQAVRTASGKCWGRNGQGRPYMDLPMKEQESPDG